MANREENLKKINDELEKLNDEQLEQVAGGTFLGSNNRYPEEIYNLVGIRTDYHLWKRDEFFAKSETTGKEIPITYTQANWAVEYAQKTGEKPCYERIAANCQE